MIQYIRGLNNKKRSIEIQFILKKFVIGSKIENKFIII